MSRILHILAVTYEPHAKGWLQEELVLDGIHTQTYPARRFDSLDHLSFY